MKTFMHGMATGPLVVAVALSFSEALWARSLLWASISCAAHLAIISAMAIKDR